MSTFYNDYTFMAVVVALMLLVVCIQNRTAFMKMLPARVPDIDGALALFLCCVIAGMLWPLVLVEMIASNDHWEP